MDDIRHKLPAKPTRFIDCLRLHMRESGLAYRTEQTYVHWIKRFIYFHDKRHPKGMGAAEIEAFLSYIGVQRHFTHFCGLLPAENPLKVEKLSQGPIKLGGLHGQTSEPCHNIHSKVLSALVWL